MMCKCKDKCPECKGECDSCKVKCIIRLAKVLVIRKEEISIADFDEKV